MDGLNMVCHVGGRIVNGPSGFDYEGCRVKKIVCVKHGITFVELVQKIYKALKLNSRQYSIKIIYRVSVAMNKFDLAGIEDDGDVETIFETVASHPDLLSADLYVEECSSNIEHNHGIGPVDDFEQAPDITQIGRFESPYVRRIETGMTSDAVRSSPMELPSIGVASGSVRDEMAEERSNGGVHRFMNLLLRGVDAFSELMTADDRLFDDNDALDEDEDVGSPNGSDDEMQQVNPEIVPSPVREPMQQSPATAPGPSTVTPYPMVAPQIPIYGAPSGTFMNIDWKVANASLSGGLSPACLVWDKGQEFCKGMRFANKAQLQSAVKHYSIEKHQEYKVVISNPELWIVNCKREESGCGWRLRALKRKTHDQFEIMKYDGPHTCLSQMLSQDHSGLDAKLIASEIRELIKEALTISITVIGAMVKNKFNYSPGYKKLWVAKQKAIAEVFGGWIESYNLLPRWLSAVDQFNPGSISICQTNPADHSRVFTFDRAFWSFSALIEGFKYCRPIVSIDATFLYGKYAEKLLIATSIDGNSQIFSIAFTIVENESEDTWGWFLAYLKHYVTKDRHGICLISDRHKGILSAVADLYIGWQPPYAYHVFCLRHVASNFNDHFKDRKLKDMVKIAGSKSQVRKFNYWMGKIKELNPEVAEYLENIPTEQWTLSHDNGRRYGIVTTNLSECFNGVLKNARFLPITALVQLIFFRLVAYFDGRRVQVDDALKRGERFPPHSVTTIIANHSRAAAHKVSRFDRDTGLFYVETALHGANRNKGGNVQVVNISTGSCTCNKWQSYHFPCSHVIAACAYVVIDPWQYIDQCYHLDAYIRSYAHHFQHVPHSDYWIHPVNLPTDTVVCPDVRRIRKKGRPRSSRIRNEMDLREGGNRLKCGICREEGHTRRKCPRNKE